MKTALSAWIPSLPSLRAFAIGLLLSVLGLQPALRAQAPAPDARAQAHAAAAALFASGGDEAAEKALTDANRNPKNSAEWHLETANALLHAALEQHRAARPHKTGSIARRAVQHADLAVQKAASPAIAAAAQETAAFITERLLGDYAGAKARYQDAARRHPQGPAAKEAERIQKTEDEADRKARQPRG